MAKLTFREIEIKRVEGIRAFRKRNDNKRAKFARYLFAMTNALIILTHNSPDNYKIYRYFLSIKSCEMPSMVIIEFPAN